MSNKTSSPPRAAVIAEYNPFHNGHKYHLSETRRILREKTGEDPIIIAVMSGNFVQRGDVAIQSKFDRARLAVQNGADMTVELPVAFSLGSAETFAKGAVKLASLLECTHLSFGSECGDSGFLEKAAGAAIYSLESDVFRRAIRSGCSYAEAVAKTVDEIYDGEFYDIFFSKNNPNDILAIEYIKALDFFGLGIKPIAVKRIGAAHNDNINRSEDIKNPEFGKIASGSSIRKLILNEQNFSEYIPYDSGELRNFADIMELETAILLTMRDLMKSNIKDTPQVYHGLENRIYAAVRAACSLPELVSLCSSKRYPAARIRRIILSAFLGITKADEKTFPSYAHILAMNKRSTSVLGELSAESLKRTGTQLKKLGELGHNENRQSFIESLSTDFYNLSLINPRRCGTDYTDKPYTEI